MLNQYLISLSLAAHLLGLSLPSVIEEGVYIVPIDQRLLPAVSHAAATQTQPVSDVMSRFLPVSANRPQPPIRVGTSSGPTQSAQAALLMDADTGMVLWQKNPDTVRPIASLTKLITALVYLNYQPTDTWNHVHTLAAEENDVVGFNLTFPTGTQVTTQNLFAALLVGSHNNAALALNGATGLSSADFILEMNQLAQQIGMRRTRFVDQTGVSDANQATVGDLALLAQEAFRHADITQHVQTPVLEIFDVTGTKVRTVKSTNLLADDPELLLEGAKTGTTEAAGYCFVFQSRIEGHAVIGVILGDISDENRFADAERMIQWTSEQFDWK